MVDHAGGEAGQAGDFVYGDVVGFQVMQYMVAVFRPKGLDFCWIRASYLRADEGFDLVV